MNRVASRATIAILLALLLVAGLGFFVTEYAVKSEEWVMFSGSPHVYSGGNIGCGKVVDTEGNLLLDMNDGRVYADSYDLRKSTIHWLGDRYGNIDAPALPSHAAALAGYDIVNGVYAYGDAGGVAKLTLSADVQTAALAAMEGRKGTVAVYNYQTGAILCSVTTPNYDPDDEPDLENDPDGLYEGVYLNRFTQTTYIPGSIFKIVTLAAALEEFPDARDMLFSCSGILELDGGEITCEWAHGDQYLMGAFENSCNCAFAELALKIGPEKMEQYAQSFGVVTPVAFDGIETPAGNYEAVGAAEVDFGWSGAGQYNDLVNPCSFLTFVGAVANGGEGALPYVVENVMVGNTRTYTAKTEMSGQRMSADTARTVAEFMRNNVAYKYGDWYFPGLTVCAKTGTAEVGGDQRPNAMLAGFVADSNYPLAFIVCVEDGGYGAEVCLPIASSVLGKCVEVIDRGI